MNRRICSQRLTFKLNSLDSLLVRNTHSTFINMEILPRDAFQQVPIIIHLVKFMEELTLPHVMWETWVMSNQMIRAMELLITMIHKSLYMDLTQL